MEDKKALIQIAERQLADAEEAFRRDPSRENERRIQRAWSDVRSARGHQQADEVTVETHGFDDDGGIPNSPLAVILYHGIADARTARPVRSRSLGYGAGAAAHAAGRSVRPS